MTVMGISINHNATRSIIFDPEIRDATELLKLQGLVHRGGVFKFVGEYLEFERRSPSSTSSRCHARMYLSIPTYT